MTKRNLKANTLAIGSQNNLLQSWLSGIRHLFLRCLGKLKLSILFALPRPYGGSLTVSIILQHDI